MHGSAKGSGAPKNNENALKHGGYTREALSERAELRAMLAEAISIIKPNGDFT